MILDFIKLHFTQNLNDSKVTRFTHCVQIEYFSINALLISHHTKITACRHKYAITIIILTATVVEYFAKGIFLATKKICYLTKRTFQLGLCFDRQFIQL